MGVLREVTPIPKAKDRKAAQKARKAVPRWVRNLVAKRSDGLCEVRALGCELRAVHVHHRKLRSQGGKDTVGNLMHVCAWCHRWVHEHPREARKRGWIE